MRVFAFLNSFDVVAESRDIAKALKKILPEESIEVRHHLINMAIIACQHYLIDISDPEVYVVKPADILNFYGDRIPLDLRCFIREILQELTFVELRPWQSDLRRTDGRGQLVPNSSGSILPNWS